MRDTVAVLRGGQGGRYEESLHSGGRVLQELDQERFVAKDVFIDRQGEWHVAGVNTTPERALRGVDVAFVALHGGHTSQSVHSQLAALHIPHTGSNHETLSMLSDRRKVLQSLESLGLSVPRRTVVHPHENTAEHAFSLFRSFPQPSIMRPLYGDQHTVTAAEHYHAFEWGLQTLGAEVPVMVEEFVRGRRVSVGIIEQFRGQRHYATLPLEIMHRERKPVGSGVFDLSHEFDVPARLSAEVKRQLSDAATAAHTELGLTDYSVITLVVGRRGLHVIGVEALPELSARGHFSRALEAAGVKASEFLTHVIGRARTRT